jgi:hypothetical protein
MEKRRRMTRTPLVNDTEQLTARIVNEVLLPSPVTAMLSA